MITIKIGLGQSPSGKVLDRSTHWYGIWADSSEKLDALAYHDKTGKPIFVSYNNQAYHEITREQLINLPDRHGRKKLKSIYDLYPNYDEMIKK